VIPQRFDQQKMNLQQLFGFQHGNILLKEKAQPVSAATVSKYVQKWAACGRQSP